MEDFSEAVARVRGRIAAAAARNGRRADEITLLPVTKVFPAAAIQTAYAHGFREFGENYVQEFEGKHPALASLPDARFHLIGHLQSNKSRRASELFQVIQTVDSAKLARRLNESGQKLEVMIEVKLSEEPEKWGVREGELPGVIDAVRGCPNLALTGLMTIPEWSSNPEDSRPAFARLRAMADHHRLAKVSMGMSNDLEVAIEEGSTMVRIGTALFGSRKRA